MAGLKLLKPDELDSDQRVVYDALTKGERGKRANLKNDEGSLVWPFNAMLYSLLTGNRFQSLGESLRFFNRLPPDQVEIVILVVAAERRADFEWWAHERLAKAAGVDNSVISAIRAKQTLDFHDDEQALVHEIAVKLLGSHRLDEETYTRAVATIGESGLVDLQFLTAYYMGVSMLLNTFEVPLPDGASSPF